MEEQLDRLIWRLDKGRFRHEALKVTVDADSPIFSEVEAAVYAGKDPEAFILNALEAGFKLLVPDKHESRQSEEKAPPDEKRVYRLEDMDDVPDEELENVPVRVLRPYASKLQVEGRKKANKAALIEGIKRVRAAKSA